MMMWTDSGLKEKKNKYNISFEPHDGSHSACLQPCHAGKTFAVRYASFKEEHDLVALWEMAQNSNAWQKVNSGTICYCTWDLYQ
jgi:hypothetical protein